MPRGHRPFVAIAEAKRMAVWWGFELLEMVTDTIHPFDFAIYDEGSTSVVRVRRLKYALYGTESILRNCAQPIKELREMPFLEGTIRELWVRGPKRAEWHRYRILPDTIEEVMNDPEPDSSVHEVSGGEGREDGVDSGYKVQQPE